MTPRAKALGRRLPRGLLINNSSVSLNPDPGSLEASPGQFTIKIIFPRKSAAQLLGHLNSSGCDLGAVLHAYGVLNVVSSNATLNSDATILAITITRPARMRPMTSNTDASREQCPSRGPTPPLVVAHPVSGGRHWSP